MQAPFDPDTSLMEEERVEVNQRHLIDKILARYSAEFTVYRELIQNAGDAGAEDVEIFFMQSASQEPVAGSCDRVLVRNNGRLFLPEDWQRLRKIAEGNPDMDKIGFFGVGFYSLFSVCEEPFIQSGSQCMAFYWKGDALYTRKGPVASTQVQDQWTTFTMNLRERMDIPPSDQFGRFLAMALLFTGSLQRITVRVGEDLLVRVAKKVSPAQPLEAFMRMPFQRSSLNNIFTIQTVESCLMQMDVERVLEPASTTSFARTLLSMFSTNRRTKTTTTDTPKPKEYEKFSLFLRLARAEAHVMLPTQLAKEMERTTKKKPPQRTVLQIVFSGHDEWLATQQTCSKSPAFRELMPYPDQGKIYIGFPTHQTTGIPAHLAAHLIPTVERESIDFVDRTLAIWNQEILSLCGMMVRVVYEEEMMGLSRVLAHRASKSTDTKTLELVDHDIEVAAHLMLAFYFKPSTPHSAVALLLKDGFDRALKASMSILSTHGIREAAQVRQRDEAVSTFSQSIPMIPAALAAKTMTVLSELSQRGILQNVNFNDVLAEVNNRLLTHDELAALIRWWVRYLQSGDIVTDRSVRDFMQRTLVEVRAGEAPVPLWDMRHYNNIRVIPPTMKLPSNTLPVAVSRQLSNIELEVLNLKELDLLQWTRFITDLPEFESSPDFSESILEVIARNFNQQNNATKVMIAQLLAGKACIPTTKTDQVMYQPAQTYFKNVTLFPDLPIINFKKSIADSFLKELGVRNHVELQMVFDRLDDLQWDHYQLIKYLASVRDQLTPPEIVRLRQTAMLPLEKEDKEATENAESGVTQKSVRFDDNQKPLKETRYPASQLYAPQESFRHLKLPLIDWPKNKWKANSPEAKLLTELGLKTVVPLNELLVLASSSDKTIHEKAMAYLTENFQNSYSSSYHAPNIKVPFLPCVGTESRAVPLDCYIDAGCMMLGFKALVPALHVHAEKLGIRRHPSASDLVTALTKKPPTMKDAPGVFTYLAGRTGDFLSSHWSLLSTSKFIPYEDPKSKNVVWLEPTKVYFKKPENQNQFGSLFTYIDFGSGNSFLKACGVKDEPTALELAQEIGSDPQRFLDVSGIEQYLAILRQIALYSDVLKRQNQLFTLMKKSPFLIGFKRKTDAVSAEEPTDQQTALEYHLAAAHDIVLVDDSVLQQVFNPLRAPIESLLEDFYALLGSQWLSQEVQEAYEYDGRLLETDKSKNVEALIKERAPLFFYNYDGRGGQNTKELSAGVMALNAIQVREVSIIRLKRKWRNQTHSENTAAFCGESSTRKQYVLLVAGELDYFSIARVIGRAVFRKAKLNDILLLETLLSARLTDLKRKGFPVDRILNRQQELKSKIIKAGSSLDAKQQDSRRTSSDSAVSQDTHPVLSQMKALFPDCDEKFLAAAVALNPSVEDLCNQFLDSGYPRQQGNENQAKPPPLPPRDSGQPEQSVESVDSDIQRPLLEKTKSMGQTQKENVGAEKPLPEINAGKSLMGQLSKFLSTSASRSAASPSKNESRNQIQDPPQPNDVSTFKELNQPLKPMSDSSLLATLRSAARSCKHDDSNEIVSSATEVVADNTNQMCTIIPSNNLLLIGPVKLADRTISFYADKTQQPDASTFRPYFTDTSGKYPLAIRCFSSIIFDLADLFEVRPEAVHLFYANPMTADGGNSWRSVAAFNRNSSLFFNLHEFIVRDFPSILKGLGIDVAQSNLETYAQKNGDVHRIPPVHIGQKPYVIWFTTMCHELAHNFASAHNEAHGRYTSNYVEAYMPKLIHFMKHHDLC